MRPDFYLPLHHAVIEYAGRMDLPGYRLRHREKVGLYEHNGIRCYEVFPEDVRRPYWAPRLIDSIEDCLPPVHIHPIPVAPAIADTIELRLQNETCRENSSRRRLRGYLTQNRKG